MGRPLTNGAGLVWIFQVVVTALGYLFSSVQVTGPLVTELMFFLKEWSPQIASAAAAAAAQSSCRSRVVVVVSVLRVRRLLARFTLQVLDLCCVGWCAVRGPLLEEVGHISDLKWQEEEHRLAWLKGGVKM